MKKRLLALIAAMVLSLGVVAPAAAYAPYWSIGSQYCFGRTYYGGSNKFMDVCYRVDKLYQNTDLSKDYFTLDLSGTAWAMNGTTMAVAEVDSQRSGGSAQSWVSWSPQQQLNGNCNVQPLTIAAAGVALGVNATVCETWYISKGTAAGTFQTVWVGPGTSGSRAVEQLITVSVPRGGWPVWNLNWGMN